MGLGSEEDQRKDAGPPRAEGWPVGKAELCGRSGAREKPAWSLECKP